MWWGAYEGTARLPKAIVTVGLGLRRRSYKAVRGKNAGVHGEVHGYRLFTLGESMVTISAGEGCMAVALFHKRKTLVYMEVSR